MSSRVIMESVLINTRDLMKTWTVLIILTKSFDNIKLDGTMELTINIAMTWKDDKLTFLNIMVQGSVYVTNTKDVYSHKQSKLWLPLDRIVHENAVIGEILSGTNAFVRVAANTEVKDPHPKNPNEGNVST